MRYPGVYKVTMLFMDEWERNASFRPKIQVQEVKDNKGTPLALLLSLLFYGILAGLGYLLYWTMRLFWH